jgi:tetratricopeptide (TPR) repeat protein
MMDAVPWFFLLPPLTVAALAIGTLVYKRTGPGRARSHLRAGGEALYGEALDDAEREFRAGLALAPEHAGLLGAMGSLLTNLGRFDEALPMLTKAKAADPKDFRLAVLIGTCEAGAGDLETARATWGAIPPTSDAHLDAQLLLSQVHREAGDLSGALACLELGVTHATAARARPVRREIRNLKKELEATDGPGPG